MIAAADEAAAFARVAIVLARTAEASIGTDEAMAAMLIEQSIDAAGAAVARIVEIRHALAGRTSAQAIAMSMAIDAIDAEAERALDHTGRLLSRLLDES